MGARLPEKKSAACIAWNEPCQKQGLPLGCDRLRRLQLDDKDNPYNTYQHEGLPPGPIANPGRKSMEAVISPDGSDFLFFVAKNDRGDLAYLLELIAAGKLRPVVERTYPLSDGREAVRYLGTGQARAKVVITNDVSG